ncbi:MAG: DUF1330 domain-containing protein [Marinibacterium sp.]|nr:DUF1330 domain-containing protein [Marinibacterium sp.]
MPYYVAVQLAPTDPETLQKYFAVGADAVARHGGTAIAGGPDARVLEDNGGGPPAKVLLSFPDAASADAWITDPDLADVHALRRKGARTTITLLPPLG